MASDNLPLSSGPRASTDSTCSNYIQVVNATGCVVGYVANAGLTGREYLFCSSCFWARSNALVLCFQPTLLMMSWPTLPVFRRRMCNPPLTLSHHPVLIILPSIIALSDPPKTLLPTTMAPRTSTWVCYSFLSFNIPTALFQRYPPLHLQAKRSPLMTAPTP